MRRYLVDAAVGLGLFALIMLAEFAVTLPFGFDPADDAGRSAALTWEFALAAPCALLLSFLLARARHTSDVHDGARRGLIWLVVVVLLYGAIAVGNGTQVIFSTWTFYLLLACVAVGPTLAGQTTRRSP